MTSKILNLFKEIGETPLERLNRARLADNSLSLLKMSYAGRLDPLAEGVLLVLVGDANKEQKEHFSLDKEYEIEVLFGFNTDTYDILGIPRFDESVCDLEAFDTLKTSLLGEREEEYPAYSSKTVLGKPLFYWARKDKLSEIKIPKRQIRIDSIDILDRKKISKKVLEKEIIERIKKVKGDFRQKKIIESWINEINKTKIEDFDLLKLKVRCGEGAYMRTLAHKMGILLGGSATIFSIKRTLVGDYKIEDSLR